MKVQYYKYGLKGIILKKRCYCFKVFSHNLVINLHSMTLRHWPKKNTAMKLCSSIYVKIIKNPDFQRNKPQTVCCKNIKHMPTDDKTGCRLCSCSLSTVSRRRGVETRPNRFAISSLACRTTRCLLCDGPHHPWFWGGPSAQALMASSKMKDCRRRMAESISDLWKAVIEGLNVCNVTINSSQISSTIGILGLIQNFGSNAQELVLVNDKIVNIVV